MYKRISPHGDYDHIEEVINLVNNFKVKKVIFNCGHYNDLEQELIKVLDKKILNNTRSLKKIIQIILYYIFFKQKNKERDKIYDIINLELIK